MTKNPMIRYLKQAYEDFYITPEITQPLTRLLNNLSIRAASFHLLNLIRNYLYFHTKPLNANYTIVFHSFQTQNIVNNNAF